MMQSTTQSTSLTTNDRQGLRTRADDITKEHTRMNKAMWIGVVAGIGVAVAGGVAGYSFLGEKSAEGPTAAQPAASVEQECWDEQVATVADPKDPHRIAGTAVGAVVGGAVGEDIGDRGITTAAGAAAGALIGRKIQEKIQDNHAEQRTVTTIEHQCAPIDSR
jgi:uncharacterized protein YcfJ